MIEIASTGTGKGYHQALSFHGCPRRAIYEASLPRNPAGAPEYFIVGTVGHELLRRWRLGNDVAPGETWILDGTPLDPAIVAEAFRVFQAYKMTFPRRDFGEVVATEMKFPVNEEHAKKIQAVLGSARTGSADLVVRVNAEDVARLAGDGLSLHEPGIYVVDDKFEKDGGEFTLLKHRHSLQFQTYMVMYALISGEEPKGAIVNVLVKNKTPKFVRIFVPPPTEATIRALQAFYSLADSRESVGDAIEPTRCLEHFRICPLLNDGTCQRF